MKVEVGTCRRKWNPCERRARSRSRSFASCGVSRFRSARAVSTVAVASGLPQGAARGRSTGGSRASASLAERTALSRRTPPQPSPEGREDVALVPCGWSSALMAHDLLLDRAEDRAASLVLHLDPDRVAEAEEFGRGLAVPDGFDGAHLGEAGIAAAPFGDRPARPALRVLFRDRAGADDRACRERPRLRRVADQGRKIEGHVVAGVRAAENPAVDGGQERQGELRAVPGLAELIRRDRDRREGGGGL